MTIIKTILLVVNIVSFAGVIIILPFGIYEFFAGRERAECFLRNLNVNMSYKNIEIIFFVCLVVAFVTYIIRDQLN